MKKYFLLRLLLLFLLITIGCWSYAQSKIDFNLTDVSVLEVIQILEDKSDYRFVFDKKELENYQLEGFQFKNAKIPDILDFMETQLPLEFLVKNKSVSIRVVEKPSSVEKNISTNGLPPPPINITISGTVTDATTNEPLIGATVYLKNNPSIGNVTDLGGKYELSVPEGNEALIFSYNTGFQKKEVPIGGRTVIDVALGETPSTLDEVIVVGYTEKKIKDLTGSVGVVKLDGVKTQPINSVEQALQGRVTGAQVTGDGSPGGGVSVRIRGYGTIGNNEPLYIIDGVPTKSGLNQFNVNDIASIQILKDAAATAMPHLVPLINLRNGSNTKRSTKKQSNKTLF